MTEASTTLHVYLYPQSLDTTGYAYGVAFPGELPDVYRVSRLNDGRWDTLDEFETDVPKRTLDARVVAEGEVLSGIGTYVGGCVFVKRTRTTNTGQWDYGVVINYSWPMRTLRVVFPEGIEDVAFDESSLDDVTVAIYVIWSAANTSTTEVTPLEMKAINEKAANHFNRVEHSACRNTKTIRQRLGLEPDSEARTIPLFDINGSNLLSVSTKSVLDFVCYKEGAQRIPGSVTVGDSIFDGARPFTTALPRREAPASARAGPAEGDLSDSAGDSDASVESVRVGATPAPMSREVLPPLESAPGVPRSTFSLFCPAASSA